MLFLKKQTKKNKQTIFHFKAFFFFCRYTHGRGNEALQKPSTEQREKESNRVEERGNLIRGIHVIKSFLDHDAWGCSTILWRINQVHELYWNGCVRQMCVLYARLLYETSESSLYCIIMSCDAVYPSINLRPWWSDHRATARQFTTGISRLDMHLEWPLIRSPFPALGQMDTRERTSCITWAELTGSPN